MLFGTAVPFGLNSRQQNAWMYYGGGIDLMNEFYATQESYRFPLRQYRRADGRLVPQGNQVPCRHAGRENAHRRLRRQGDLQDRRRAAAVARRRDLQSLEKGAIDAAEWVGPYDDEKLGFYKVAPYYYYPGWWEGGAMLHTMINTAKWAELTPTYQSIVKTACQAANVDMQAKYDARNPEALKKLVASGAKLAPFPQDVLEACFNAAKETYAEISGTNAAFKKIHDAMMAFRADAYLWSQFSEFTFDRFMMGQQRKKML